MRVALWYFANPNCVDIRLEGVPVSGIDIAFDRDRSYPPRPELVRILFHEEAIDHVFLFGNSISLRKAPRSSKTWVEILPDILVFLRDYFDPGGRIVLARETWIHDREPLPGDFIFLPHREPFGERRLDLSQMSLFESTA